MCVENILKRVISILVYHVYNIQTQEAIRSVTFDLQLFFDIVLLTCILIFIIYIY